MNAPVLPYTGIRILDLTRVLAGPYATLVLADLGAEVIKIETTEGGDDARHFQPPVIQDIATYFLSFNLGIRSIIHSYCEFRVEHRGTYLIRVAG